METYFKNLTAEEGTRKKLIQDLRILIDDAEALIRSTGGDWLGKSKEEVSAAFAKVKSQCEALEEKAVSMAKDTDRFVQEKPLQSIGIAFGAGLILGLFLNRK